MLQELTMAQPDGVREPGGAPRALLQEFAHLSRFHGSTRVILSMR
jgi:hypothetical protein